MTLLQRSEFVAWLRERVGSGSHYVGYHGLQESCPIAVFLQNRWPGTDLWVEDDGIYERDARTDDLVLREPLPHWAREFLHRLGSEQKLVTAAECLDAFAAGDL
jgi:hypothetical protein